MKHLLVLFAFGCATVGPKPPSTTLANVREDVAQVVLCKTTADELKVWFGPPRRDGRLGKNRVQAWLLGDDPERVLAVMYDEVGRVIDLLWDVPGLMSWTPTDRCPAR